MKLPLKVVMALEPHTETASANRRRGMDVGQMVVHQFTHTDGAEYTFRHWHGAQSYYPDVDDDGMVECTAV